MSNKFPSCNQFRSIIAEIPIEEKFTIKAVIELFKVISFNSLQFDERLKTNQNLKMNPFMWGMPGNKSVRSSFSRFLRKSRTDECIDQKLINFNFFSIRNDGRLGRHGRMGRHGRHGRRMLLNPQKTWTTHAQIITTV